MAAPIPRELPVTNTTLSFTISTLQMSSHAFGVQCVHPINSTLHDV
jgi:hypothetical protein